MLDVAESVCRDNFLPDTEFYTTLFTAAKAVVANL